jgi:hypothetical protein
MQVLLFLSQSVPFNNREHDDPHVRSPELLENPVAKRQKVPGVFDIQLACGGNIEHGCDFKQLRAKCGRLDESCVKVSRHRRLCDLPCATDGTPLNELNVEAPVVSSASVISSLSAFGRATTTHVTTQVQTL